MFDTDWNPQMDKQAQSRVHRLGQTKPVLILRLFIPNTVEEQILQVSQQKQDLADAAITGGFFDGKTSASDRQAFLLQLIQRSKASGTTHSIPRSATEVCPHLWSSCIYYAKKTVLAHMNSNQCSYHAYS